MNLFSGLGQHEITSVLIAAVVFVASSGLALVGLLAFGVRSGLMAPKATSGVPVAADGELLLYLGAAACGLVADFAMVFMGLAENFLDNPLFFPISIGLLVLGGVLLVAGVGIGLRTIRRSQAGLQ
jgi:hypothetical protein